MHASTQLRRATVRASHKCRYCSSSGGAGCAGTHRCSGKWVRGGEEGGGGGGGGGEQQAYQKEEEVEECGARREMAEHRRHQEMFAEKKKRRKRLQPTDELEPKKKDGAEPIKI